MASSSFRGTYEAAFYWAPVPERSVRTGNDMLHPSKFVVTSVHTTKFAYLPVCGYGYGWFQQDLFPGATVTKRCRQRL